MAHQVQAALRNSDTVARLGGDEFVSGPGSTADQLLHDADHAMYRAKRDGKARHRMGGVTDAGELARSAQALRAMQIDTELRESLIRDELVVFGQPVFDVNTGSAVAVETLLRCKHPERGLLVREISSTSPRPAI